MARFVTSSACGQMSRSAVLESTIGGRKSWGVEPAFAEWSSSERFFGNCAEILRKENAYQSAAHHDRRKITRVRVTLMVDYFATLGVKKNASKSEIKRAYKKLAKLYHPDVCREDQSQTKFIQIVNAYEEALNCVNGSTDAFGGCEADNYAEDCREELEDWESWMGWEGAGSPVHDLADFPDNSDQGAAQNEGFSWGAPNHLGGEDPYRSL